MRSRLRLAYAYLALAGVAVVGIFTIDRPGGPSSRHDRTHAGTLVAEGGEPSVRGLDALWRRYGDRAGCSEWNGADGMQSTRLNRGKLAWFFSDTYLGPAVASRGGLLAPHTMLQNSLVIESEHGDRARLSTVTGGDTCRENRHPPSYARPLVRPDRSRYPHQWYWSADAMVVGHTLVKFYNRYHRGGARYLPKGTAIASFDVDHLTAPHTPAVVHPRMTETPTYTPNPGGAPIMWGAALLRAGAFTYVYGWQVPDTNIQDKRLYVARVATVHLADFGAWRFAAGGGRWSPRQADARPVQPVGEQFAVSPGFSVMKLAGRYWLIQHEPDVFDRRIDAYPADSPAGPFDPRQRLRLFDAPEVGQDAAHHYIMIYEARVNAALSTKSHLVIGYSVNTAAVSSGCRSLVQRTDKIYRPRFITVVPAAFPPRGALAGHLRGAVTYDPHPVGRLPRLDPSQWHNGWAGRPGCPPVPRIAYVGAQLRHGSVTLSWPSAGLDISYRVYARQRVGGRWGGYLRVGKTPMPEITLSGYRAGATYEWKVVPVNSKHTAGRGVTITRRMPR